MKKNFQFLIVTILVFGLIGLANSASLEVTTTGVTLSGTDGIKGPNGNYVTVPPGGIIMWSGAIANIPAGWSLCDGNNGTPNLTDRFVLHADADSGGANNVGDTGGSNTIATAQLPSHTHDDGTLATNTSGNHTHRVYNGAAFNSNYTNGGVAGTVYPVGNYNTTTGAGTHSHDITGSTGSTGSNAVFKPRYYSLAYIMKL